MQVAELFSLKDKVAAVVGGTGVLGATFCRGLADAVEVTVARHLAVLVALLVLVQQLERRAEAEAVHELDDGD